MGAEVVLCEPGQAAWVAATGRFEPWAELRDKGQTRMLLFARRGAAKLDKSWYPAMDLNRAFDRAFAPKAPLM